MAGVDNLFSDKTGPFDWIGVDDEGRVRRSAPAYWALCGLLVLGGCTPPDPGLTFLHPQGPVAAAQRTHLFGIVAIVLIVVLPVIVLAPLYAWRYRYRNTSARYIPRWGFSRPLEFLIWGVPFAIVIGLAVWLSRITLMLDPYKPLAADKPLRIQVIGYDWKWFFIYPDSGIASIGQLAFPVGRSLALELTSDSVIQSFFIPALGSQIYAMGGMVTHLHLAADAPGRFLGENTQYNGDGFAKQKFIARAMTPVDYESWLKRVKATGIRLTPEVYEVIRMRTTKETVREGLHADHMPDGEVYFSDVSPDLFGNVVRSFHGGPSASGALLGGKTGGFKPPASAGPAGG